MFIQKLCLLSFHFSKINKRAVGIRAGGGGGLENFSKSYKWEGDYLVLESTATYCEMCIFCLKENTL